MRKNNLTNPVALRNVAAGTFATAAESRNPKPSQRGVTTHVLCGDLQVEKMWGRRATAWGGGDRSHSEPGTYCSLFQPVDSFRPIGPHWTELTPSASLVSAAAASPPALRKRDCSNNVTIRSVWIQLVTSQQNTGRTLDAASSRDWLLHPRDLRKRGGSTIPPTPPPSPNQPPTLP